jgi:hypothetical protein
MGMTVRPGAFGAGVIEPSPIIARVRNAGCSAMAEECCDAGLICAARRQSEFEEYMQAGPRLRGVTAAVGFECFAHEEL